MLHWIEDEDHILHRYIECSHWGLIFTSSHERWWRFYPITNGLHRPGNSFNAYHTGNA